MATLKKLSHETLAVLNSPNFILDLEPLHLLPIISEWKRGLKLLLPAFLGTTLLHSVLSTFLRRLASRVDRSWLGRINRYMMPRNPSREPNSRDSAQYNTYITLTFKCQVGKNG